MINVVNVILHGVYGYIFRSTCIEAYTPAVCGHIYKAGGLDYKNAARLRQRVDYSLQGVSGDPQTRCQPDCHHNPVLPLASAAAIDPFTKRFCMIRLPYPAVIDGYPQPQYYPVDSYVLGAVYSGRDATPLNAMDMCPSAQVIAYPRNDERLRLDADDGGKGIDLGSLTPQSGTGITNVHIWCTINPDDMSMSGMTPEGHIRRAFAALVDLVPALETTLQIPDGFSPSASNDDYPPGVGPCDVDPGSNGCVGLLFGKVNCHYSNLMFWPAE
jgi:hypothetical protein